MWYVSFLKYELAAGNKLGKWLSEEGSKSRDPETLKPKTLKTLC